MKRVATLSATEPTINAKVLEEAAEWLMRLHAGTTTEQERADCARWQQRSPQHALAWARAELLLRKFGGLPASLAMPALDRPNADRRAATVKLAALLAVVPAGLSAWRIAEQQAWMADYRTGTGERRDVRLDDGTAITLNTATAIDVHFDATQRFIRLREGEIIIETAADIAHRPFRVGVDEGRLEALGTRFSVRQYDNHAQLAVFEGAVRVEPRNTSTDITRIVQAGQQTTFTANRVAEPVAADENAIAWTHGMLVADRMRLADFAIELARYRFGIVRCDPDVADFRVSGAFPIEDTNRALSMLVATYPVSVSHLFGDYWTTLGPKQN